ncbi:MAG: hypothetical protein ACT4P4_25285 [Betaproteobacteria bacterium]
MERARRRVPDARHRALSAFSHRSNGGAYTAALLRAMCFGMASLVAFFVAVALLLPPLGLAAGVLRRAGA